MLLFFKNQIFFFIINISFLFSQAFEGYTLFTPMSQNEDIKTLLINNNYEIINSWEHEYGPASMPYLLPDSSIIYPYRVPNPSMEVGGVGGGLEKQSWTGEKIWDYRFSDENYQHHHDIEPLPNGNILIIVWENKTAIEAYQMGREIIDNPLNQMWSTALLELNPNTGEIEWEWHLWDHLVQDIDASLPNYGIISEHPELFDINCGIVGGNWGGPQNANADWMHINSVHYNQDLDQIIISSRTQNEIYIIDHSTTTEEAASHSGGDYGKGGDILYRWGNPINYGRGSESDQVLFSQHSVNWIPNEYPGGGNILLYNNLSPEGDVVIEFSPPFINEQYLIEENEPFSPSTFEWSYNSNQNTPLQGGAFRLPNGNTLITQTHTASIIEINPENNIVWEYQYTNSSGSSSWINRAQKYSIDYLGGATLEGDLNGDSGLNVLDLVILVNLVLSQDYIEEADFNSDGGLNILDIVQLANIILNQ